MKAMKALNMNRMLGSIKRSKTRDSASESVEPAFVDSGVDTPEANAVRNVQAFCNSGGPNGSGDEVVYLPVIVESVDASPTAAKEASVLIRKYLSKDNFSKPHIQYNAIMLLRILADNPGKTFTRNVDSKFVDTVKQLLRLGRDPSVKQILMETLDTFQRDKKEDEGLALLNEMWKKEYEKMSKLHGPPGAPRTMNAPPFPAGQDANYFSRSHSSRRLPDPQELASRIEEARTSATLLSQTVQSTPPSEIIQNDLVREFADRCQSASRSIQAYMIAENPSPDNDTMETLIETNEQLTKALSQHQRAVLQARKAAGLGTGGTPSPAGSGNGYFAPPAGPPPNQKPGVPARKAAPQPQPQESENPFTDPADQPRGASTTTTHNPPFPKDNAPPASGAYEERLGIEPYHPGFGGPSQSYVGRQDSSVGKVTMHAAGDEEDASDDEREAGRNASGSYGAKPGTKAPVYRY